MPASLPTTPPPTAVPTVAPPPTSDVSPTTAARDTATTAIPLLGAATITNVYAYAAEEASSSQDSQGNPVSYEAHQTIDGRMDTAWRVPGDGIGKSVALTFMGNAVRLSEVRIVPGYAKIDPASGENRFLQERRVRRVRLEFSGMQSVEADLADRPELQSITFAPVVTAYVRVVVLATTLPAPKDGRDFTPISEIVPVGQVCQPGECGAISDDINALVRIAASDNYFNVLIQAIDGDYARVVLSPKDPAIVSDGAIAFYKRTGGVWTWMTAGTDFDLETLTQLGVPKTLLWSQR